MKVMLPVASDQQSRNEAAQPFNSAPEEVVQAVKDGVARSSRGGVAVYDICRPRRVRLFTGRDLMNDP
jgi:hypothetical protein